jgi:ABC-2 type transport system ATP-binding protein
MTAKDGDGGARTRTGPRGSGRGGDPPGSASQSGSRASSDGVAVAVEGLSKRFGGNGDAVLAVDDVSFEIEAGTIVGLLGANGAGKTTLIKSILGMVLPDEGTVRINGIDTREHPRAAYGHVDALLEGARNDYWRLTVRENLRYFATISGVDPDSVAARHERLLDRLGLSGKADVPVRDLSRGMKQKVSLASVLAGGAEVIFLDEPTLGLDVESARTLQAELRHLVADRGLTVVLSSHDMHVVEAVCDRVLVVSDGRIVADDAVDNLLRGEDTHTVRLASRDLDPQMLPDLRGLAGVTGVEPLDPDTRLQVTTDSEGLYAVMAYLRDREVTLERVATVEADLESVFVALTDEDGP